jgi:dihydroflavonol-4-reductase
MTSSANPRGLVLVTGGSGYIAGYCIARLLADGWRVRTTVRSLARAEDVRATIGAIAPGAAAIEFAAADLNADAGWAEAAAGADYVLHVASPVPAVDTRRATTSWCGRRATGRCASSKRRARPA